MIYWQEFNYLKLTGVLMIVALNQKLKFVIILGDHISLNISQQSMLILLGH